MDLALSRRHRRGCCSQQIPLPSSFNVPLSIWLFHQLFDPDFRGKRQYSYQSNHTVVRGPFEALIDTVRVILSYGYSLFILRP